MWCGVVWFGTKVQACQSPCTGRTIHFQIVNHLCEFLSGVRTFGVMPHLGQTRLDTVPVDWVADAICWASSHEHMAAN